MTVLQVSGSGLLSTREYTEAELNEIASRPADIKIIKLEKVRALLRLDELGLYSQVKNYISSLSVREKILWDSAVFIEKENPLIQAIATELGWDDSQINQFFADASEIQL